MDHGLFRYDEPYARPRRKVNFFGWTITILLLTGVALAAWLGSYYVFNQPERPDSYRILQKLHKIEQPKRFQITAAPAGEFLDGKKLYERYGTMRPAELAKTNAELARDYIRNYQGVAGHVPYVVGRYTIMEARPLTENDLFTSGMVALTTAAEYGELLMEHVYPADAEAVPLMKETLATGLEIKLERSHDLSVVLHADRLPDGRVLVTTVPLLYGTYTVTQGRGMFSLEPPFALNMAAGWPLFKDSERRKAEIRYASFREKSIPAGQAVPLPGLAPSAAPAAATNALVRVEQAIAAAPPQPSAAPTAVVQPTTKGGKVAKNTKPSPSPAASTAMPSATVAVVAKAALPAAKPAASATPAAPVVAVASPAASIAAATPTPAPASVELASTAGGGNWKTYPAGKMPVGRLITTSDLSDVADRGLAGERVYLKGQFVVNFAEANRAVLRPKSNMAEKVLRLGAPSSTRIIVEFPAGYTPPTQGSVVDRNEARPYEITEVRKQSDGQLNVFVREIMQ